MFVFVLFGALLGEMCLAVYELLQASRRPSVSEKISFASWNWIINLSIHVVTPFIMVYIAFMTIKMTNCPKDFRYVNKNRELGVYVCNDPANSTLQILTLRTIMALVFTIFGHLI